jgi:hypothetical protein
MARDVLKQVNPRMLALADAIEAGTVPAPTGWTVAELRQPRAYGLCISGLDWGEGSHGAQLTGLDHETMEPRIGCSSTARKPAQARALALALLAAAAASEVMAAHPALPSEAAR